MPRRRGPPRRRPSPGDRERRLAEEVLYLHSLWRRGPPAASAATAPRKPTKHKRRRLHGAAKPRDSGAQWAIAPSPPNSSPKTWPEAAPASTSSPAKPPPPPASPGALAHREALRAAAEFFSNRGSSSGDDEDGGSESEGEQDAAGFLTGLFERDAALRGHYERGWEEGQFACLACTGGTRKPGRRFQGCVALVQHARATTRYGRPRAHRALAAVICRVLGWDIDRLPSIVMDPRGTLGQALATRAKADVQLPKDVETGTEDSSTDGDEEANELETSGESDEEEDVETGMEGSVADGDEEANELASSGESAEKEDAETVEGSKKDDGDKEAIQLDNGEKIAEKFNGNKDDSLFQDNNVEVHDQEIAKEYTEQENTNNVSLPNSIDTCKNVEHGTEAAIQEEANPKSSEEEDAKTSVDNGDGVTRLENNSSMEENAGENEEEQADKTS